MSLIIYKALAALIIFLASLVTVIYPLKTRAHPGHNHLLEWGDAFASGIFLGAALFHMLPAAIVGFNHALGKINYPLAELICAAGFLLLLLFERIAQDTETPHHPTPLPYIIAIIIILHSLIEGAVLGIYTTLNAAAIIFFAIIAHKSSESFALAVTLNRSHLPFRQIIILITLFALMTPLGIALGSGLESFFHQKPAQLITAGLNAFAAGTFLYMSTLHHINHHEHAHQGEGLTEFFILVLGLCVMAGVAVWG